MENENQMKDGERWPYYDGQEMLVCMNCGAKKASRMRRELYAPHPGEYEAKVSLCCQSPCFFLLET